MLGDNQEEMYLGDVKITKMYLGDIISGGEPSEEYTRELLYNQSNIATEFLPGDVYTRFILSDGSDVNLSDNKILKVKDE